jgi:hypothetical protein
MNALWLRSMIAFLALEWQLCREDPFVFCYRMGVSLLPPQASGSSSASHTPS